MKHYKERYRDAKRYRALRSTENAAPWKDVLGPHKNLDSLSDALVDVVDDNEVPFGVVEDAPGMSIGGGAGLAGLTGDPPVSRFAQKRWVRKNAIVRRKPQG